MCLRFIGPSTNTVYLDGTSKSRIYDCCHLESMVGRDGTVTSYTYDDLDRVLTSTRDGITSSNVWNCAGDLLTTYRFGTNGDAIRLKASTTIAGRMLGSTNALDEVTFIPTQLTPPVNGRHHYQSRYQHPDSNHRARWRVVDHGRDGTLPMRFTNGIVSLGGFDRLYSQEIKLLTNGTDSGEWRLSINDGLGRTRKRGFWTAPPTAALQSNRPTRAAS